MSSVTQGEVITLPEYAMDDLGTSFKVVLVNSVERRVSSQGPEVNIPHFQDLMKQIAIRRAMHPLKLSGGDIKFLRKNLGMKSKDLAAKLDISPEHMSRCESAEKVLASNSEKVLRSLVLLEAIYVARKALEDASPSNDRRFGALVSKLTNLIDRTKAVMEGLTISPIRDAKEECVFHFTLVSELEAEVANDDSVEASKEWLLEEMAA